MSWLGSQKCEPLAVTLIAVAEWLREPCIRRGTVSRDSVAAGVRMSMRTGGRAARPVFARGAEYVG
jgi:hypothetical protein